MKGILAPEYYRPIVWRVSMKLNEISVCSKTSWRERGGRRCLFTMRCPCLHVAISSFVIINMSVTFSKNSLILELHPNYVFTWYHQFLIRNLLQKLLFIFEIMLCQNVVPQFSWVQVENVQIFWLVVFWSASWTNKSFLIKRTNLQVALLSHSFEFEYCVIY